MDTVATILVSWCALAVITAFAIGPVIRQGGVWSVRASSPYDGEGCLPQNHEVQRW